MSKWAPDNEQGEHPYIVTTYSVIAGEDRNRIVYAKDLTEAKFHHGARTGFDGRPRVRRAKPEDMPGGAR